MKSIIKFISLFLLLNLCFSVLANCDYEPGQVLVKMKANKSKAQKTSLKTEMQAVSLKTFSRIGLEFKSTNLIETGGYLIRVSS